MDGGRDLSRRPARGHANAAGSASHGMRAISPMRTPCGDLAAQAQDRCLHPLRRRSRTRPMRGRIRSTRSPPMSARPRTCSMPRGSRSWRRFVLVSTGSVFQLRRDIVETDPEDQAPEPANVYSTTKVGAEHADPDVSQRVRALGLDGAHLLGVRAAGDQRPAEARADPVLSAACAARRADPRGRRGFRRELHLCGGRRRSAARRRGRAGAAPRDLSFRARREFHRRAGGRRGAQGGARRRDRACRRHRAVDALHRACAVRSRATGSSRTPATRRRTRSKPASRPMRTGCARTGRLRRPRRALEAAQAPDR